MQKTGPQRVPPCSSWHLQLQIGTSICNKKQPSGLTCMFFFFLPFFNCGWMVLNCDWMLFTSINKANPLQTKKTFSKTAVFNQNPMEIPSEPIRKQMFLNQNPMKIPSEPIRKQKFFNQNPMEIPSEPIRQEMICQNVFRSLGGWSRFRIYYCESDPPQKKERGAGGFAIVDATLVYNPYIIYDISLCNHKFIDIILYHKSLCNHKFIDIILYHISLCNHKLIDIILYHLSLCNHKFIDIILYNISL